MLRVHRLVGLLVLGLSSSLVAGTFQDVPRSHWAYKAIRKLQKSGMIQGRGKSFQGSRAFSRYEMAVVLARYMEKLGSAKASIQKSLDRTYPLIKKLAREFSSELDLLGVKHQELLARVTSLETRTDLHDRNIEELRALVEENRRLLQALRASPLAAQARGFFPEPSRAAALPAGLMAALPQAAPPQVYRTIAAPPTASVAPASAPAPAPMFRVPGPSSTSAPRAGFQLAAAPRNGALFASNAGNGLRVPDAQRLHNLRMRARALLDDRAPPPVGPVARAPVAPMAGMMPLGIPSQPIAAWGGPAETLVEAMGRVQRGEMDLQTATQLGRRVEAELGRSPRRGRSQVYPLTERLFGPGGLGPPTGE